MAFTRLTDYYIDPSTGNDTTGDGSSGTPWKTLQNALDNITQGTNGDMLNLADTAAATENSLSLATYGTPSNSQPLAIRGWDNGGGTAIGEIDLSATATLWESSAYDHIHHRNLKIHNAGSGKSCITLDDYCSIVNCELTDADNNGAELGKGALVAYCHIHDIATQGILLGDNGGLILGNYFKNDGTRNFVYAIRLNGNDGNQVFRNIFSLSSSSIGIRANFGRSHFIGYNSILSSSGTGVGIEILGQGELIAVINNIVEGFSGAGGIGYDYNSGELVSHIFGNAAYNNTTDYNEASVLVFDENDNETLGSSGFAKSGSDTFANRFTYFAPVDTGNVIGGAVVS